MPSRIETSGLPPVELEAYRRTLLEVSRIAKSTKRDIDSGVLVETEFQNRFQEINATLLSAFEAAGRLIANVGDGEKEIALINFRDDLKRDLEPILNEVFIPYRITATGRTTYTTYGHLRPYETLKLMLEIRISKDSRSHVELEALFNELAILNGGDVVLFENEIDNLRREVNLPESQPPVLETTQELLDKIAVYESIAPYSEYLSEERLQEIAQQAFAGSREPEVNLDDLENLLRALNILQNRSGARGLIDRVRRRNFSATDFLALSSLQAYIENVVEKIRDNAQGIAAERNPAMLAWKNHIANYRVEGLGLHEYLQELDTIASTPNGFDVLAGADGGVRNLTIINNALGNVSRSLSADAAYVQNPSIDDVLLRNPEDRQSIDAYIRQINHRIARHRGLIDVAIAAASSRPDAAPAVATTETVNKVGKAQYEKLVEIIAKEGGYPSYEVLITKRVDEVFPIIQDMIIAVSEKKYDDDLSAAGSLYAFPDEGYSIYGKSGTLLPDGVPEENSSLEWWVKNGFDWKIVLQNSGVPIGDVHTTINSLTSIIGYRAFTMEQLGLRAGEVYSGTIAGGDTKRSEIFKKRGKKRGWFKTDVSNFYALSHSRELDGLLGNYEEKYKTPEYFEYFYRGLLQRMPKLRQGDYQQKTKDTIADLKRHLISTLTPEQKKFLSKQIDFAARMALWQFVDNGDFLAADKGAEILNIAGKKNIFEYIRKVWETGVDVSLQYGLSMLGINTINLPVDNLLMVDISANSITEVSNRVEIDALLDFTASKNTAVGTLVAQLVHFSAGDEVIEQLGNKWDAQKTFNNREKQIIVNEIVKRYALFKVDASSMILNGNLPTDLAAGFMLVPKSKVKRNSAGVVQQVSASWRSARLSGIKPSELVFGDAHVDNNALLAEWYAYLEKFGEVADIKKGKNKNPLPKIKDIKADEKISIPILRPESRMKRKAERVKWARNYNPFQGELRLFEVVKEDFEYSGISLGSHYDEVRDLLKSLGKYFFDRTVGLNPEAFLLLFNDFDFVFQIEGEINEFIGGLTESSNRQEKFIELIESKKRTNSPIRDIVLEIREFEANPTPENKAKVAKAKVEFEVLMLLFFINNLLEQYKPTEQFIEEASKVKDFANSALNLENATYSGERLLNYFDCIKFYTWLDVFLREVEQKSLEAQKTGISKWFLKLRHRFIGTRTKDGTDYLFQMHDEINAMVIGMMRQKGIIGVAGDVATMPDYIKKMLAAAGQQEQEIKQKK